MCATRSVPRTNARSTPAARSAGSEVLAEWDELVAVRLKTLRGGDDSYFAKEMQTPTGPGTLADFLQIRVLDCWAHEQDIRRALGRPGNNDTPAAEHAIDRLLRTIPIVVGKRAAAPDGTNVVLEITGPVRRTVPVTVDAGRAKVVERVPDAVHATIRMSSDTFATLALGRRTAAELAGEWAVVGDTALGETIVGQLNLMI